MSIEAGYVGNRGVWENLGGLVNPNALTPAILKAHGIDLTNATTRTLMTSQICSSAAVAARPFPRRALHGHRALHEAAVGDRRPHDLGEETVRLRRDLRPAPGELLVPRCNLGSRTQRSREDLRALRESSSPAVGCSSTDRAREENRTPIA